MALIASCSRSSFIILCCASSLHRHPLGAAKRGLPRLGMRAACPTIMVAPGWGLDYTCRADKHARPEPEAMRRYRCAQGCSWVCHRAFTVVHCSLMAPHALSLLPLLSIPLRRSLVLVPPRIGSKRNTSLPHTRNSVALGKAICPVV